MSGQWAVEMKSMDSDDETDWSLDQIHSVYESRFLTEYQPLKLLGRGNFSRVFEANKISDAKLYAIKRIKLPLGKESRSQIMKQLTVTQYKLLVIESTI